MTLEKNPLAMKSGDVVSEPEGKFVLEVKTVGLTKVEYIIQVKTDPAKWIDQSRWSNLDKAKKAIKTLEDFDFYRIRCHRIVKRTITDEIIDG